MTLHDRLLRAVTERLDSARLVEALSPSPWQANGEEWGKVRDRQGNDLVHDVFEVELQCFVAANDPATVIRQCEADLRRLERHRLAADLPLCTWCMTGTGGDDLDYLPYPCLEITDLAAALGVAVDEGDGT